MYISYFLIKNQNIIRTLFLIYCDFFSRFKVIWKENIKNFQ